MREACPGQSTNVNCSAPQHVAPLMSSGASVEKLLKPRSSVIPRSLLYEESMNRTHEMHISRRLVRLAQVFTATELYHI